MAKKLLFGWWLCKDTTIPMDYPPKCEAMLIDYRLENSRLKIENLKLDINDLWGKPPVI